MDHIYEEKNKIPLRMLEVEDVLHSPFPLSSFPFTLIHPYIKHKTSKIKYYYPNQLKKFKTNKTDLIKINENQIQ